MSFWQENYAFIKDVYDMRHHKMAEWMENVEKVSVGVCPYLAASSKYSGKINCETISITHSVEKKVESVQFLIFCFQLARRTGQVKG